MYYLLIMKCSFPQLEYEYDALVQYIDKETMQFHHKKHHKQHLEELNELLLREYAYDEGSLIELLTYPNLEEDIRFYGSAHFNHCLFWKILSPNKVDLSHKMKKIITQSFGSIGAMKNELVDTGCGIRGSGWLWLCKTEGFDKLIIDITTNEENPFTKNKNMDSKPILCIDLWEHSYYLKYKDRKGVYLERILEIIDWNAVESLYKKSSEQYVKSIKC